jgi:hypothetical protein
MTPIRRDLLEALAKLSEKYPDVRLAQHIANISSWAECAVPNSVYDIEDEELLAAIRLQLVEKETPREAILA